LKKRYEPEFFEQKKYAPVGNFRLMGTIPFPPKPFEFSKIFFFHFIVFLQVLLVHLFSLLKDFFLVEKRNLTRAADSAGPHPIQTRLRGRFMN